MVEALNFDKLLDFTRLEHERLVTHYDIKGDSKTKYAMLAKVMEELGELSEAILKLDSFQRSKKLKDFKTLKEHLSLEFADVLLTVHILAQEMGVDISAALKKKIEQIKNRKY